LLEIWRHVTALGAQHGVNPTVFGVLYLSHHPLFWGTVAWIVTRVRRRLIVWPHSIVAAAFWLMPYIYLVLCARQIPWWGETAFAAVLVFGGFHAAQEIRKKIRNAEESGWTHESTGVDSTTGKTSPVRVGEDVKQ
jgi:hypothetical protein